MRGWWLFPGILMACNRAASSEVDAVTSAAVDAVPVASDAPSADAVPPPPPIGEVVVPCTGLDPITEHCSWRYAFHPATCTPAEPCSKLVVFFAGGEQRCDLYDDILDAFAGDGYVAVCAQLFETSTASGCEPYAAEAGRVDAVLASVRESALAQVWDGRDLLLAGVSHGATAPVVAMARTTLDDQPHWRGTRTTGACFFDGIYDIAAIDEFLGTGAVGGGECTFPLPHQRIVGRYYSPWPACDGGPESHSCTNDQCACDADHHPAMDEDTLVGSGAPAAAAYAIADWKLVECGSGLAACLSDVVPAEPIAALCALLDEDAGHTCVYETMPESSHVDCAGEGVARCSSWFDALLP